MLFFFCHVSDHDYNAYVAGVKSLNRKAEGGEAKYRGVEKITEENGTVRFRAFLNLYESGEGKKTRTTKELGLFDTAKEAGRFVTKLGLGASNFVAKVMTTQGLGWV